MKKIKSIIAGLMIITSLVAIPIGVNAEWKQSGTQWVYNEGNSYARGWKQINGIWYYFDSYGYMKTGWVNDYGKYYYLNENGAWNNSAALTIMPDEIKNVSNIIHNYIRNGEILNYLGMYSIDSNSGSLSKAGLKGKDFYEFCTSDEYGNEIDDYFYQKSTGDLYKLNQGTVTQIIKTDKKSKVKYSYNECEQIADAYFGNSHVSGYKYEVLSSKELYEDGTYYFTVYSQKTNKLVDAFSVNAITGEVVY